MKLTQAPENPNLVATAKASYESKGAKKPSKSRLRQNKSVKKDVVKSSMNIDTKF